MSQNHIDLPGPAGHPVHLIIGWDRRLSEFFITPLPAEKDLTDYSDLLFSKVDGVEEIRQALSEIGMEVPQSVLDAVEADRQESAGNVCRWFDATGALIETQTA